MCTRESLCVGVGSAGATRCEVCGGRGWDDFSVGRRCDVMGKW